MSVEHVDKIITEWKVYELNSKVEVEFDARAKEGVEFAIEKHGDKETRVWIPYSRILQIIGTNDV